MLISVYLLTFNIHLKLVSWQAKCVVSEHQPHLEMVLCISLPGRSAASKVVSSDREAMTSQSKESYAKLREALKAFPKICQEMEVSRLYCTCNRSSRSPCLMAEGVKTLLQGYLRDFEVAANSRLFPKHRSDLPDFIVHLASRVFWPYISSETRQVPFYCLESWKQAELSSVAEDLESLSLLGESPTDPVAVPTIEEPFHLHMWKDFGYFFQQPKLRQQCILLSYGSSCLQTDVQKAKECMADSLNRLKDVHLELEKREGVNSELRSILKSLAQEVASYVELQLKQIQSTYTDYQAECMKSNEKAPESLTQFIFRRRDDLWQSCSRAAALFFEVEEHVSSLRSPEMKSDCSWSLISETPKDQGIADTSPERWEEVASAASGHSVDSQSSCLSGQGGPHCFLPSHLFHVLQSGVGRESPSAALVLAQDRKYCLPFQAEAVNSTVAPLNAGCRWFCAFHFCENGLTR